MCNFLSASAYIFKSSKTSYLQAIFKVKGIFSQGIDFILDAHLYSIHCFAINLLLFVYYPSAMVMAIFHFISIVKQVVYCAKV